MAYPAKVKQQCLALFLEGYSYDKIVAELASNANSTNGNIIPVRDVIHDWATADDWRGKRGVLKAKQAELEVEKLNDLAEERAQYAVDLQRKQRRITDLVAKTIEDDILAIPQNATSIKPVVDSIDTLHKRQNIDLRGYDEIKHERTHATSESVSISIEAEGSMEEENEGVFRAGQTDLGETDEGDTSEDI